MSHRWRFAWAWLVGAVLLAVLPSCDEFPIPWPTPAPAACVTCAELEAEGAAASAKPLLYSVAQPIAHRYIVVMRQPAGAAALGTADVLKFAQSFKGLTEVKAFSPRILSGFVATVKDVRVLAELVKDKRIRFIQQDGVKQISKPQYTQASVPWGLDRIDQPDLPLDGKYGPKVGDGKVAIYVMDTGCPASGDFKTCRQDHPDFGPRLQAECYSAVTFQGCNDAHGHGTHCTGTAAGTVWGVCKNCIVYAWRVLDAQGSGSDSGIIEMAGRIAEHDPGPGVRKVNSDSWGGGAAPALDLAMCNLRKAGVVVAVAGGNDTQSVCNSSPSRVKDLVSVMATDKTDQLAWFSNFGEDADIAAPGVDVESDRPDGGTETMSGTSMGCPHAAGVAALILQLHPDWTVEQVEAELIRLSAKDKLKGVPAGTPNRLLQVEPKVGGGDVLFPDRLLKQCSAEDPRWCLADGTPIDHGGFITCCLGNPEVAWDGWPLATVELVDWSRTAGNSDFWHRRGGPFVASDEYWDLEGHVRPTRGPSARDLSATLAWQTAGIGGPYVEVGGKADLTQFNEAFFSYNDQVLDHICSIGGWSEDDLDDGWRLKDDCPYSPFNPDRNVQGENHCALVPGDPVHEAWIRKWVKHSGRFGCVTYQISNESRNAGSNDEVIAWERWVVEVVRDEETKRGYQRHPILTNSTIPEIVSADWIDGSNWHGIQYAPVAGKITACNEINPAPWDYEKQYCLAAAGKAYLWMWRAELPFDKWKADLAAVKKARESGCPEPSACTLNTPTARELVAAGKEARINVQRSTAGYVDEGIGSVPRASKWISATPLGDFGRDYYCQPGMNWPEACASPPRPGPVAPEGHPQRPPCEARFLEQPCPTFSEDRCTGTGAQCPITWDTYIVIDGVNQLHPSNVAAGCLESTYVRDGDGYLISGQWWKATAHGKGYLKACNVDGSVCGVSSFEIDQ